MKRISPVPVLAKRKQRTDKAEMLQAQSSTKTRPRPGIGCGLIGTTAAGDLTL